MLDFGEARKINDLCRQLLAAYHKWWSNKVAPTETEDLFSSLSKEISEFAQDDFEKDTLLSHKEKVLFTFFQIK